MCAEYSYSQKFAKILQTDDLEVEFNKYGLVQRVKKIWKDIEYEINEKFVNYDSSDHAGAYIFMPANQHTDIQFNQKQIKVQTGPLVTVITSILQQEKSQRRYVHSVSIPQSGNAIQVTTTVFAKENEEVMLSLFTDPKLEGFHTFNSVDFLERTYQEPRSISETGQNFYPIAAGLLVGQPYDGVFITSDYPFGAGNLKNSTLFSLHRNIDNDDNLGLAYKLKDITETTQTFNLKFGALVHDEMWDTYLRHHQPLIALTSINDFLIAPFSWVKDPIQWPYASQIVFGHSDNIAYLSSISIQDKNILYRIKNLQNYPVDIQWLENAVAYTLGGQIERKETNYTLSKEITLDKEFTSKRTQLLDIDPSTQSTQLQDDDDPQLKTGIEDSNQMAMLVSNCTGLQLYDVYYDEVVVNIIRRAPRYASEEIELL